MHRNKITQHPSITIKKKALTKLFPTLKITSNLLLNNSISPIEIPDQTLQYFNNTSASLYIMKTPI
ncbi:hypothetical protein [Winogradskyella wichelsiae]|uniref:hypothetical protein n=1 Tax=Winogradskyella wichelsiae TaxID=2697007 RepID=UPI0015CABF5C|nr:hypothetical protein [Winogradskyella wichelsiae]